MMKKSLAILSMSLLLASCAESDTQTRASKLETQSSVPSPPKAPAEVDPAVERAEKQKESDRKPVGPTAEKVDWSEVAGYAEVDPKLLPKTERAKLSKIEVPVLLPDDGRLLGTALITHNVNWYAAAMELQGADIYIRGTRNALEVPAMEIPEAAAAAADNYTLTRTHQIVTVSWRSFNVSYSLDVECAKPMSDTRCTEDEFALSLAERLSVANAPKAENPNGGVAR